MVLKTLGSIFLTGCSFSLVHLDLAVDSLMTQAQMPGLFLLLLLFVFLLLFLLLFLFLIFLVNSQGLVPSRLWLHNMLCLGRSSLDFYGQALAFSWTFLIIFASFLTSSPSSMNLSKPHNVKGIYQSTVMLSSLRRNPQCWSASSLFTEWPKTSALRSPRLVLA